MRPPQYLTLPAVARLLGLSAPTIWRWARDQKLPTVNVRNPVTGVLMCSVAVAELTARGHGPFSDEQLKLARRHKRIPQHELEEALDERDAEWMCAIYERLGFIVPVTFRLPDQPQEQK